MCPNTQLKCSYQGYKNSKKQQGSMLTIALFVIVVFGLLGITMTRVLSSSSESIVYEVLGQRALNAARSGLERCLAAEYPVTVGVSACSNPTNFDFSALKGLESCSAQVIPNNITVSDNSQTYSYVKFSSIGRCGAGSVIVTRSVYVDAML
ncbi:MSHA biogenesis protein MshP [Paraglaciecola aquimarina]|uniref:MSHA biogenesis protein MshP n=1 Tax=Paraglaciecola aquimarina TaxID=1235557 RepID=A0ABU3SSX4_9ALTE|nr:MSHA biogenesis protein MshP [Paraglaciecola aquimarina]MDU0353116.1 MSHA biogenesis protein MshP [Paraglaciecola aquimarina]